MEHNLSYETQAEVLIQALPYMQKHRGTTVVVKYGGNAMINGELKQKVMSDIVLLSLVGIRVVLVHGGGPEISQMLKRLGKESRFVAGMRYTDQETVDVVQMVLAGKVNKDLTQLLTMHGGRAIGLSGLDSGLLQAEKMETGEDLGYVGQIKAVDCGVINDVLDRGYIPVVSTVAGGGNGEVYNVNADIAAARIAAELGASKLILMTDIAGLLRDKEDDSTLISVVDVKDIWDLKREGIISGGMIPKVDCCVDAIHRGVARAHIIDGRIPHSILIEMFSDAGIGTMFY